ncbi:hypothetical protein GCM10025774_16240 [Microbacterium kyungheense]
MIRTPWPDAGSSAVGSSPTTSATVGVGCGILSSPRAAHPLTTSIMPSATAAPDPHRVRMTDQPPVLPILVDR